MMERGDVILTPSWSWHDHGSEGHGPMVWLDGLDLPVYKFLPVNFAENYHEERYPSEMAEGDHDTDLKFRWRNVAEVLDQGIETEGKKYARFDYRLRDGGHLSRTISAQTERVSAGYTTDRMRETVSFVYHVYEGEGRTRIVAPGGEGKEVMVEWKARKEVL